MSVTRDKFARMTMSHDILSHNAESEAGIRSISPLDKEVFSSWLQLRQQFMERQGWHTGDDHDVYDDNPETLHVIKERPDNGAIAAGMRLTPIDRIEASLSMSMLAPYLREQASQNMPKDMAEKYLWDLTRLVPGQVDSAQQAKEALLEIFGAGLALTAPRTPEGLSTRWIFAANPSFITFFKREGITFHPIVSGRNSPTDTKDTVLCYADPLEQAELLRDVDNPNYKFVVRGAQET